MSWGLLQEQFGGGGQFFVDMLTDNLTTRSRQRMADAVNAWLIGPARKKALPNLQDKLKTMGSCVDLMMESIRFAVRDKEIVVIVDGPAEETLKALANGTDWFDPCDDIVSIMISALRDS